MISILFIPLGKTVSGNPGSAPPLSELAGLWEGEVTFVDDRYGTALHQLMGEKVSLEILLESDGQPFARWSDEGLKMPASYDQNTGSIKFSHEEVDLEELYSPFVDFFAQSYLSEAEIIVYEFRYEGNVVREDSGLMIKGLSSWVVWYVRDGGGGTRSFNISSEVKMNGPDAAPVLPGENDFSEEEPAPGSIAVGEEPGPSTAPVGIFGGIGKIPHHRLLPHRRRYRSRSPAGG